MYILHLLETRGSSFTRLGEDPDKLWESVTENTVSAFLYDMSDWRKYSIPRYLYRHGLRKDVDPAKSPHIQLIIRNLLGR